MPGEGRSAPFLSAYSDTYETNARTGLSVHIFFFVSPATGVRVKYQRTYPCQCSLPARLNPPLAAYIVFSLLSWVGSTLLAEPALLPDLAGMPLLLLFLMTCNILNDCI